ncbi:hypothetical protein G6N05_05265 [Flavobacterium sp. F372]|uniref:Uncharacterized protein n=1 Tax=Flavobacterium bernardetii TaxID=2813823 RepID=A0ABR7J1S3_9FLAO|nr:hypothetical protein [Flavobacterium bernardetii]MBC5835789.1 hypothetical protein [Flavobacterium bernardetii]NHF69520.1 hypothetical protein [Flavobacterium bernardetii]
MKLAELDQFLKDCIKAEIAFPRETMTVVIDDYYEVVPSDRLNEKQLEYNTRIGHEMARVLIIPNHPIDLINKAKKYDDLEIKISKCYFDENGDELSEEESENIDLGTIGEIAATHFNFL